MRTIRGVSIFLLGLAGGALATAAGCFDSADDCEQRLDCIVGTGGGSSSSTGTMSSSTGTTGGGMPEGCDPSKAAKSVADGCGIFVSPSGDDGNAGTKAKPVKTITAALKKGATIYACVGATPFSETVTLGKAATLYGAVDCVSWIHDATKKTHLTAGADAVPLTAASTAGGAEIHDFVIAAADAKLAGGSSIAVLDDHAELTLERVDVDAGVGAAGAAGMPQAQVMTPATANGGNGTDDAMCNVPGSIGGGLGGKNMCGGMNTGGGIGGFGAADLTGGDGGGGKPVMMPSNLGSGQTTTAPCNPGAKGFDGSPGTPGTGARGIGDLSASGYQGAAAVLGTTGVPGQGGGGGGGARQCDLPGMFSGPSGGGGGAGGCAGSAGSAAQSGGSSIGILALGAKLTLSAVTITTKDGGAGGLGGNGQQGGAGGLPGSAIGAAACSGGPGGHGGAGGPGAGGAGGHSIAVAIKGGTLPDLSSTTIANGKGAAGGAGGDMDLTMQTRGDGGLGCKTLDFTNPMSPSACAM
jgi:hypothetical protein